MPRRGWKARARPRLDRRTRRRRLRHRRGACRPDRGARGGAARLVGRRAGGAKRRLERIGPQHRRRAAGICASAPDALIERVGLDQAQGAVGAVRGRRGICAQRRAATCRARRSPKAAGCMCRKPTTPRAMAHEAALLAGEFGAAVEPWPADRVREALHSPRYFHGLHYPRGFCLHPLNYALGLAAAAEAAGARIFEDTPVLEIDPAGVRKRVVTSHSRVRAAHVVLAGNVHHGGACAAVRRARCCRSSTTSSSPRRSAMNCTRRSAIPARSATSRSRRPSSPRRGRRPADVVRPQHGPARQAAAPGRMRCFGQIRRTYPALRGVKADYAWIGVAGHTVHGMPQIGEITPGLWLLSGFGGHGLNTTAMGGEMRRARHRRGRPDLADVLAVRAGVGRRRVRPRRAAGVRLVAPLRRDDGRRAGAHARGATPARTPTAPRLPAMAARPRSGLRACRAPLVGGPKRAGCRPIRSSNP